MKILTHGYVITIYENGKFVWKNKGWVEGNTPTLTDLLFWVVLVIVWWS